MSTMLHRLRASVGAIWQLISRVLRIQTARQHVLLVQRRRARLDVVRLVRSWASLRVIAVRVTVFLHFYLE